jgi:hypothetical protein
MTPILTTDVEAAFAEPWPYALRLKYMTVGEILDEVDDSNRRIARTACPLADYLREHVDDNVIDVEATIQSHPEWGPAFICESIRVTRLHNSASTWALGEELARLVQRHLALALFRYHPFERARTSLSDMLYHPRTRIVNPEAAYVLLAYINAGHPNPGRWLAKPEIARHFPGIEVERFAAPDFT